MLKEVNTQKVTLGDGDTESSRFISAMNMASHHDMVMEEIRRLPTGIQPYAIARPPDRFTSDDDMSKNERMRHRMSIYNRCMLKFVKATEILGLRGENLPHLDYYSSFTDSGWRRSANSSSHFSGVPSGMSADEGDEVTLIIHATGKEDPSWDDLQTADTFVTQRKFREKPEDGLRVTRPTALEREGDYIHVALTYIHDPRQDEEFQRMKKEFEDESQ